MNVFSVKPLEMTIFDTWFDHLYMLLNGLIKYLHVQVFTSTIYKSYKDYYKLRPTSN